MYLVRMAEAEAEGRLTAQERLELDVRLAADPAFAIAYQEYFHTISGLHESQRRHDFKRLLGSVHEEVTAPRKPLLPPRPGPSRPLGPDDDPEFLRDLNRRRREKKDDDS